MRYFVDYFSEYNSEYYGKEDISVIYLVGEHAPVYVHAGSASIKYLADGNHAYVPLADGSVYVKIIAKGSHVPVYTHGGAIEWFEGYIVKGSHSPVYSHAGACSIKYNAKGSHAPVYSHAGDVSADSMTPYSKMHSIYSSRQSPYLVGTGAVEITSTPYAVGSLYGVALYGTGKYFSTNYSSSGNPHRRTA